MTIAIIGCGSAKKIGKYKAEELYTGKLFKDRKKYAEYLTPNVLIISAKYGLLNYKDIIEDYKYSLCEETKENLRIFKDIIIPQLDKIPDDTHLILMAGKEYTQPIKDYINQSPRGLTYEEIGNKLNHIYLYRLFSKLTKEPSKVDQYLKEAYIDQKVINKNKTIGIRKAAKAAKAAKDKKAKK